MLRDMLTAARALVVVAAVGATLAASEPSFAQHPTTAAKKIPTRGTPPQVGPSASTAPAAPVTTGTVDPASQPPAAGTATAIPAAPAVAPVAPADPIVAALRTKLADAAFTRKSNKDDVDALVAFYAERTGPPVWVDKDGATPRGKAIIAEIGKADDWGLAASAFELPSATPAQLTPEALAETEGKIALAALKYARFARGGRFNPSSLSRILDQTPPVKDPKEVLAELEKRDEGDAYLRSLHPQHEQFARLRQALLKARGGPVEKEAPVDEALRVKLPAGKILKTGADDPTVALLRKRLKIETAPGTKETLFDEEVADAVKAYQRAKGLKQTGSLNGATRSALNAEGEPKKIAVGAETQRILINMERWRWMPEDLGNFYVWDNVPEFAARVIKDGKEIFKEKIIVGEPAWATPTFSAKMENVTFSPSWGVPDGIKQRELLPRLRSASGFFFFGGGGGDVLRAYGLTAYRNGKPVDPDSVDWGSVDIRNYSFVQPPGGKNPLGFVKFRFPNKHDVYMHDTVQRELFAQSYRALSHGCMRVQNPRRFAEILLAEDKGWSTEKVANAMASGQDVALDRPIPTHVTYFTALVDDDGRVRTFSDIYGHDSRLAAAMTGRAIQFESEVETSYADDGGFASPGFATPAVGPGNKKKKTYKAPENLAEAISGLLSN
jgi:murein L,D-transpeptidase YcbB/YkuD